MMQVGDVYNVHKVIHAGPTNPFLVTHKLSNNNLAVSVGGA